MSDAVTLALCRLDGGVSALTGLPLSRNPYPRGTPLCGVWRNGWWRIAKAKARHGRLWGPKPPQEGSIPDKVLGLLEIARGKMRIAELATGLNVSENAVREAVRRLRASGWPIASVGNTNSHSGFWLERA